MELIKVYAVGPKSAQAVLARPPHVLRSRAAPLLINLHTELRGDHHFVTPPPERARQEFFAPRSAVDVGSVEEVDAGLERGVNDSRAGLFVYAPPEVVAAESDHCHLQRSDPSCFHCASLNRPNQDAENHF